MRILERKWGSTPTGLKEHGSMPRTTFAGCLEPIFHNLRAIYVKSYEGQRPSPIFMRVTFRPLNVIYSLSGSLEYTYPTPIFPTESSRSGLISTSRLGEWEIKPGKLFFFYNFDYEAFTFKLFPNSTFRSIQWPRQIHQKKLKGPLLNFLHLRHSFSITSNKCWTGDATETRDFFGWEPLTWCKCLPPARMKLKQTEPYVPSHPRNLVKFLINNYSPYFNVYFNIAVNTSALTQFGHF